MSILDSYSDPLETRTPLDVLTLRDRPSESAPESPAAEAGSAAGVPEDPVDVDVTDHRPSVDGVGGEVAGEIRRQSG